MTLLIALGLLIAVAGGIDLVYRQDWPRRWFRSPRRSAGADPSRTACGPSAGEHRAFLETKERQRLHALIETRKVDAHTDLKLLVFPPERKKVTR